jgi:lipopolysaccharide export system permease protein
MTTILSRRIFLDLIPPFVVNLLFFVVIFLITKVLDIVNMIVNYHVQPLTFILLLTYSMPFFLAFIIPMSVMMSILLTFLRMSADNEITALKSCGISPHRLLVPVLIFSLLGWALTSVIEIKALPWGNRAYNTLSVEVAQNSIDAIVKERTFIDAFDDVMLYINQVDMQTKTLKDVFIEDQRTPGINNTIMAPRGRISMDVERHELHLKLFQGTINQVNLAHRTADKIDYDTYEMKLDLGQVIRRVDRASLSLNEMPLKALALELRRRKVKDKHYYSALLKYHEKFAVPFACLALGLLALPLGMVSKRAKRSSGMVMGIILFLVYFILLSVGWSFGESGSIHPVVGMWAPNIVLGGLGAFLYWRTIRDRPLSLARLGKP